MDIISVHERLATLEKRNNRLKSLLLHDQLKYGSYSYKHLEDKILLILKGYKINRSIALAAFNSGINPGLAIKWFVEGQKGNPNFKILYSGIKRINNLDDCEENVDVIGEDYEIECIDGSWVYTTYVDSKKVSLISSDLDHLKEKVSDKNLPLY
ncbi:MAG: hypothetical protein ACSW71_03060 [Methanobrevibacter sp.]